MKIKLYDQTEQDINAGLPYDVYFSGRVDVQAYEIEGAWVNNPAYDLQKVIEAKNKEIEEKRKQRYREETDPMYFSIERQSSTKEEWLAAVEKIKKELPYVTG
jgi:hypothetical protein